MSRRARQIRVRLGRTVASLGEVDVDTLARTAGWVIVLPEDRNWISGLVWKMFVATYVTARAAHLMMDLF